MISEQDAWAPVLPLGELMMIWRHLDSEVAFFHYLTRRATLEDYMNFEGDEQDILSVYLTNGLHIDRSSFEGKQLRFIGIDDAVRSEKTPCEDRTVFRIFGLSLQHYWYSTLREIYQDRTLRHRFDIIQLILNQESTALSGIVQYIQRWKRGLTTRKKGDTIIIRNQIGQRVFLLAFMLAKRMPNPDQWTKQARTIARNAATEIFEASDCVVMMRVKNSHEATYDAISFFRFRKPA